jgi:hypothetical protein
MAMYFLLKKKKKKNKIKKIKEIAKKKRTKRLWVRNWISRRDNEGVHTRLLKET